jgi:quinol monooxygenase YgiN
MRTMCSVSRPPSIDPGGPMITFIARMTVRPEHATAYEALLTEVRDLTRAKEPGVVYYDFGKSADHADEYVVVEVYRDADAHAAHMAQPWVTGSIPRSRALVEGKFDITQWVSPGTEPAVRRMKEG